MLCYVVRRCDVMRIVTGCLQCITSPIRLLLAEEKTESLYMLCNCAMQDNISSFGAEETDVEDSDEEPDICHMPAVHNPLPALKHAELLLRFPQLQNVPFSQCRQTYISVRDFVVNAHGSQA